MPTWIKRRIEKRLGGYRQTLEPYALHTAPRLTQEVHVAVIGAGLAGFSAAIHLAEKGAIVRLYESADYLGGKCGAWPHTLPDGKEVWVEHGFHAVFRQYYNCRELLERSGVSKHYKSIDDYLILGRDKSEAKFADIETVPVLNLLSLWKKGMYKMWDILSTRAIAYMPQFLRYDPVRTFEKYDHMSYDEFCEKGKIPEDLRFVFNTFARAFFAEGDKLSMAEVLKSFHFYFLSHDLGLLYEYMDDGYHHSFITPLRTYFESLGGRVLLNTPVKELQESAEKISIDGTPFDHVVLSTDIPGVKSILEASQEFSSANPEVVEALRSLKVSQRYSVLRIWANIQVGDSLPVFVITEKHTLLDSITFCHRAEKDCEAWADETGGGVYELHCYAVPESVQDEAHAERLFLEELHHYLPEFKDAQIVDTVMQLNRNFSAFHTGMSASRPMTRTPNPRLKLAGDWVKLPCPAMLMEAASTSGLLAANAILAEEGVSEHPVYTVPLKGVLA